jgi:hypothetical protein
VMGRAISNVVPYQSLSADERLRRYVAAVERKDWKVVQRLKLSAPVSRKHRPDPAFLARVDALRRLTYRVVVVLLSATSMTVPVSGSRRREVDASWFLMDPSEGKDRKVVAASLDAIRLDLKERVKGAAELWLAFDAFCNDAAGSSAISMVMVFCPRERDSVKVIVDRARRGDVKGSRVEEAKIAMQDYWRRFMRSEEETVLILE